ncbi:PPK2 family polyphosphate kinase [Nocardioides aurantiacus]|uniref:PPK2 family polyphosphate:nucleotide phosphotransferase n=1 Tax=Nocardioides aurantiacus TaxID=86796 RepID=A0A3N2CSM5_9ACTN|nr:PPK2 family polyphosphate kinase [Nocardioides aurantiacus]ROR90515.1 PPK2 family polyphosphate:nucleotide phosphotransferase [Nocardioides aurantiacus]
MSDDRDDRYALADQLRLPPGPVRLADLPTDATPVLDGDKAGGQRALAALGEELADLQERMYAHAYTGGARRVLVVLQGMDTSGKGGVVEKAIGLLSPNGLRITSFKKPTEEELGHDFLWRIDRALPGPGVVGVFDRSHYEDVLVHKVHELVDEPELERRYEAINAWEKSLVETGTIVLKCFLHISADTQRERLLARLDDPDKQWKFKPGDVDERQHWRDYQRAYETALERCHTDAAPWYVIPADRKWYRNWAVARLLLDALRGMELDWPAPDYDVAEQRARLEADSDA